MFITLFGILDEGNIIMETLTNIFIHIMMIGIPALVLILCICGIICTSLVYASLYIKVSIYTMLGVLAMISAMLCGVYALELML